jgi:RHS repeat-associated protein
VSLRKLLSFFVFVLVGAIGVFAQTSPNLEAGFKPYGSYEGDFGAVNLASGGMDHHLGMPMAYPQRGGIGSIQPFVVINSKNWAVQFFPVDTSGYYRWMPGGARNSFSAAFTNSFSLEVDRARMLDVTVTGATESDSNYFLKLPDGGTHSLAFVGSSTTLLETVDASGYRVELQGADTYGVSTSAAVIDRQGNRYQLATFAGPVSSTHTCDNSGTCETIWNYADQALPTSVTDTDGNVLSFSAANGVITDTLGKTLPWTASSSTSDFSDCVTPSAITSAALYSYSGPNGTTNQLKFCYANFQLGTNFSASNINQYQNPPGAPAPGPIPLLASIVLPDHTKWTFNYDSYGNVTALGLPVGGSITYTWTEVAFPSCGSYTPVSRAVASRTENDNLGHSSTWSYTWGTVQADGTFSNAVTDPLGNDTVHVFYGACGPHEISTLEYQGKWNTGQLLKRVDTHYQTQIIGTNDGGSTTNTLPDRIQTTIYPSGKVSLVTRSYDPGPGNGLPPLGDVTVEKVYDWGAGAAGALLREIDTTYLWQSDGRYLTANLLGLPASVVTKDSNGNRMAETDSIYDESQYLTASNISTQHGAAPNPAPVCGNLTTISHWLNTNNSFISSHTNWYDTGEIFKTIDPLGHTTTHSYDSAYAGAYATKTCNALSQCFSGTYDFNTGLLTSFTDANASVQASGTTPGDPAHTSNYSYDFMERLTSGTLPADGSGNRPQTTFNYPNPTTVERLRKITTTLTDDTFTYVDGLGRTIRTRHVIPGSNIYVDTTYDGLDRVATVTNPYLTTSDSTYGTTQDQYDALGRVIQVTRQDGSIAHIDYTQPNCPVSTDEAGKARKSCSDALGRLVTVWEDPAGLNYETDYQYDALGNLLRVDQKGGASSDSTQWRTRLFTYDSLSRLLTANNPESGLMTYQYDNDGQMVAKIDARGITASYSYDALHRLTRESFSDGSYRGAYSYDETTSAFGNPVSNGIGRLTSSWQPYGGQGFSYDALGRTVQVRRAIDSPARYTKDFFYAYNLDGSLAQLTYPSGRVITYAVDAAGRTTSATDSNGTSYVSNATYWPSGAQFQWHMPSVYLSRGLNNRLQTSYFYSDNGVVSNYYLYKTYDYNSGHNNGNVVSITNNNDTTRSQSFTYDRLNRLLSAQNAGTDCSKVLPDGHTEYWGNTYSYDAWGSLLQKTVSKCSAENLNVAALSNNRLSGYSYDAAGNMLSDGANTYTYDAGGMVKTAGGITYLYDADGERFQKWQNGTGWKSYWRGMGSAVLAEGDASGNLTSEYIFFNGQRLARVDLPGNAVHYYLSDHLGSTSLEVSASGVIENESDYYPWGGELQISNHDPVNHYKFTGKERDAESGLDYFEARYYSNGLGRFISSDWSATPEPIPYADLDDPQSLNLYTYVRNIPTAKVDLDGHGCPPVCDAVDMQKVKQLVDSAKPLAPLAPSAVAASPLLLLAAPSVGAMIFATEAPPVQVENCTIDCGSFYIPPPTIEDQSQKQQNQTQNQGQSNEQKQDPEPQTASNGANKGGGNVPPSKRDPKRLFTPAESKELKNRAQGRCETCNNKTVKSTPYTKGSKHSPREGQAGHKKAWSKGGRTKLSNGKWQCKRCNQSEGANSK